MFAAIVALTITLHSCNKDKDLSTASETPPALIQGDTKELMKGCAVQGITQNNGMLIFSDWNHFRITLECLESALEDHQQAFEDQYSYLSEEDFNLKAEQTGFRDFLPLEEFEEALSFNSRRWMIEGLIQTWLGNSVLDTLADPDDLDYHSEELRTLLSVDGKVMIGREVYDYLIDDEEKGSCKFIKGDEEWKNHDNNLKKFKLRVYVSSYPWKAKQKAKVSSYRQTNSLKWKRHKTSLFVQVGGFGRDFDCNFPLQLGAFKGPKRRSSLKAKTVNWGLGQMVKYHKNEVFASCELADYGETQLLILTW